MFSSGLRQARVVRTAEFVIRTEGLQRFGLSPVLSNRLVRGRDLPMKFDRAAKKREVRSRNGASASSSDCGRRLTSGDAAVDGKRPRRLSGESLDEPPTENLTGSSSRRRISSVNEQVAYFRRVLSKAKGVDLERWSQFDVSNALKWASIVEKRKKSARDGADNDLKEPIRSTVDAIVSNPRKHEHHLRALLSAGELCREEMIDSLALILQRRASTSSVQWALAPFDECSVPFAQRVQGRLLRKRILNDLNADDEFETRQSIRQRVMSLEPTHVDLAALAVTCDDDQTLQSWLEEEVFRVLDKPASEHDSSGKALWFLLDADVLQYCSIHSLQFFKAYLRAVGNHPEHSSEKEKVRMILAQSPINQCTNFSQLNTSADLGWARTRKREEIQVQGAHRANANRRTSRSKAEGADHTEQLKNPK